MQYRLEFSIGSKSNALRKRRSELSVERFFVYSDDNLNFRFPLDFCAGMVYNNIKSRFTKSRFDKSQLGAWRR